jgi:hypothetical protein
MSTENTTNGSKVLMEIKTPGAETASTIGPTRKVGLAGIVEVMLKVTAVSGTSPTLDVTIQDGDADPPTTDRWAWPQITAVGEYRAYVRTTKYHVRYVSSLAGIDPSFTYSVFVTAPQVARA